MSGLSDIAQKQTIELVMTKLVNIKIWCWPYITTVLIWTFCSCILFVRLCGWNERRQWAVLGDWVYSGSVMRLMLFNHKKDNTKTLTHEE